MLRQTFKKKLLNVWLDGRTFFRLLFFSNVPTQRSAQSIQHAHDAQKKGSTAHAETQPSKQSKAKGGGHAPPHPLMRRCLSLGILLVSIAQHVCIFFKYNVYKYIFVFSNFFRCPNFEYWNFGLHCVVCVYNTYMFYKRETYAQTKRKHTTKNAPANHLKWRGSGNPHLGAHPFPRHWQPERMCVETGQEN